MKHITIDELKRMTYAEGLVLQGCGGNPDEWMSGINELFTEAGILLGGDTFKDAYVFEHDGLTNILFSMEDMKLDIGKLAMWRLASHDTFGGTWLSDYLPNRLGINTDEREPDGVEVDIESEEEAPLIRAYIENVSKPELGGFTMPFPTTAEALRPFLEGIEVSGDDRDVAISDIQSPIPGLEDALGDTFALDELNYLAAKLSGLTEPQREVFEAVLESERYYGSVAEIINLTENLDRFELQPAFNAEQYGAFHINLARDEYADMMNRLEASTDSAESDFFHYVAGIEAHIDLEAYGKWQAENEGGAFTEQGYLTESSGFQEVYKGPEDIPQEYRVFSFPQAQEKTARDVQQVIAPGIRSDEMLGRFLYDNKMLSEKDLQAATARLSFTAYPEDCYRTIGGKRREAGNGAYTNAGYVENRQPAEKPSVLEQLAAARAERATAPEKPAQDKPKSHGPEL